MNKFKLWDEMKKRWIDQETFAVRGDGVVFFLETPILTARDNFILVRSADAHDVDSVPIYEGDILRDGNIIACIEWDRHLSRFYSVKSTARAWSNCKKIGNKFENPRLLK